MKKLNILLCTAFAAVGLASQATAAGIDLYNAHEFDLDIFGTRAFSSSDSARLLDKDANGGGLALTYFLTEYLGVGGEGTLLDVSSDAMGTLAGNAVLRAPLGDSGIALYGVGGVGVLFNADDLKTGKSDDLFEAHVGGGAKWRFNPNFGIFADVRYNFVDQDKSDYLSARVGMSFAW